MRLTCIRGANGMAALLVAIVVITACGSSSAPVEPSEPADSPFALRARPVQALPPEAQFSWLPFVLIDSEGTVIRQGPVPAIFPGPLLPNLVGAPLTSAGYDRIVGRARSLGLLEGNGDFTPADAGVGGLLAKVELLVDGAMIELTGDPNRHIECVTTPCEPAPGTPEAFGTFWRDLGDLATLVGDQLGAESPYHPEGFALLIGVEPMDDAGLAPAILPWPLEKPLADTGRPIGDRLLPRCGTVRGQDAATLEATFAQANQLTQWIDEGGKAEDAVVITARPLLAGEDVCRDLFGVAG